MYCKKHKGLKISDNYLALFFEVIIMKWMDVKTGKRKERNWIDIIPMQDETGKNMKTEEPSVQKVMALKKFCQWF